MLCRLSRLSAMCAMAVCCSASYAGLWDAPPMSNADFGSGSSPEAFKTLPGQDESATVTASCACDHNAGGYTASPAFVPAAPAYPITQSAPIMQSSPLVQPGPMVHQSPTVQGPMVQSGRIVEGPVFDQTIPQPSPVAPAPQVVATPQYNQTQVLAAPAYTPTIDPMSLAQQTYSNRNVSSQWGLFRPQVAGGAWGGRRRFYAGSEFLFYKSRGQRLPPLVTRSPIGTPINEAGRLDYPATTTVLFGGSRLASAEHTGFRTFIGMNLDRCGRTRVEADYFDLDRERFFYAQETPLNADILARPFYNTFLGTEDAELVGYPGEIDGRITVAGSTEFSGLGVGLRHSLLRGGQAAPGSQPVYNPLGGNVANGGQVLSGYNASVVGSGAGSCGTGSGASFYGTGCGVSSPRWRVNRLDFLAGYRRFDLEEDLAIREYLRYINTAGTIPFGTEFDILDQFSTENRFDGADFGVDWEWVRGRLGVSAMGKVSVGNMRQRAYLSGQTSVTTPNVPAVSYPHGLQTLSTNSGNYERNTFTVIPEIGLDVYFQVTCNARVRVGYSMIYLPNVMRPGGLIDTNLDPRLFPPQTIAGGAFPSFGFHDEDFWVQGLRLGAEYCF